MNASVQKSINEQFLGQMAGELKELEFGSIQDLANYIDKCQDLLPKFVKHWLGLIDQVPSIGQSSVPVPAGITLWYVGKLKYSQAIATDTGAVAAYSRSDEDRLRKALRAAVAD
jgi:hypothetical protein